MAARFELCCNSRLAVIGVPHGRWGWVEFSDSWRGPYRVFSMIASKFVDDLEESLYQAGILAFPETVNVGCGEDLGVRNVDHA